MFKKYNYLLKVNSIILVLVGAICIVGLINLYSAGLNLLPLKGKSIFYKQFIWILIGILFLIICFLIDYRIIIRHAYKIYIFSNILLLIVFFVGQTTRGTQRWISIGGFSIQPSEILKLTIILILAKFFNNKGIHKTYTLNELLIPFCLVAIPFLLIMKQPDLGTAIIIFIIFLSIIFFVGIKYRSLLILLFMSIFLIPICWKVLKDYQKERIITFIYPDRDPLGSGYHTIQSIIAIGSGGLIGKGFMKGTQGQLQFMPEQQTDFIFSVFAEEWGFIGSLLLIILIISLILCTVKIAFTSKDLLGTLIAIQIAMLFFWEFFINLGMVLGIFPVVGIPFPFLSYGGSSVVVLLAAIGLIMNINTRRFFLYKN